MREKELYTVRFTPYRKKLGAICARQTKGYSLKSHDGRYRFYVDGVASPDDVSSNSKSRKPKPPRETDFWVVQGKGLRGEQTHFVGRENTILLTTEPSSVLIYPEEYVSQFGMICTCQPDTFHMNKVLAPPVLPWFIGYKEGSRKGVPEITLDYDTLSSSPIPRKTKLLSVITSNKAFTQGHIDRLRFVKILKEHYGDSIDVFGHGFRSVDDKWEALAPYKYHIVIENSSEPYYWTEKLSDCLLAGAFPLYYGCTNLEDYIPRECYEPIDIKQPEQAIHIIDNAIENNLWEQRQEAIRESKLIMLDIYNMFERIASLCDKLDYACPKERVTLKPCYSWESITNLWRYAVGRRYYELKWKLFG